MVYLKLQIGLFRNHFAVIPVLLYDLIIEPFGGSGSTLIAAQKMKRRCYLMEKSPIYAEVIRNRWEKLTGKKAKKIIGGKDEK